MPFDQNLVVAAGAAWCALQAARLALPQWLELLDSWGPLLDTAVVMMLTAAVALNRPKPVQVRRSTVMTSDEVVPALNSKSGSLQPSFLLERTFQDLIACKQRLGAEELKPAFSDLPTSQGKILVLNADCEPINHMVIQALLPHDKYKLIKAFSGEEVLKYLRTASHLPDVVMLDSTMDSSMSGIELCTAVRAMYTNTELPIIVVSSRIQEEDLLRALQAGANDYMMKPIRRMELLARMSTQLAVGRSIRAQAEARGHYTLLSQMLPPKIIERLAGGAEWIAEKHPEVTILFSDIVNFTTLSSQWATKDIVLMLNEMFSRFDALCDMHGVYKVETIGDAYMIVAGHEGDAVDHATRMMAMAHGMLDAVREMQELLNEPLRIRIGMHTGPAYSGVVGIKCPRYCFFGDTVNTASRMESTGFPMCIHISSSTYEKVCEEVVCADCGIRDVKGKGPMRTFLVKTGEWHAAMAKLAESRSSCEHARYYDHHSQTNSVLMLEGGRHNSQTGVPGHESGSEESNVVDRHSQAGSQATIDAYLAGAGASIGPSASRVPSFTGQSPLAPRPVPQPAHTPDELQRSVTPAFDATACLQPQPSEANRKERLERLAQQRRARGGTTRLSVDVNYRPSFSHPSRPPSAYDANNRSVPVSGGARGESGMLTRQLSADMASEDSYSTGLREMLAALPSSRLGAAGEQDSAVGGAMNKLAALANADACRNGGGSVSGDSDGSFLLAAYPPGQTAQHAANGLGAGAGGKKLQPSNSGSPRTYATIEAAIRPAATAAAQGVDHSSSASSRAAANTTTPASNASELMTARALSRGSSTPRNALPRSPLACDELPPPANGGSRSASASGGFSGGSSINDCAAMLRPCGSMSSSDPTSSGVSQRVSREPTQTRESNSFDYVVRPPLGTAPGLDYSNRPAGQASGLDYCLRPPEALDFGAGTIGGPGRKISGATGAASSAEAPEQFSCPANVQSPFAAETSELFGTMARRISKSETMKADDARRKEIPRWLSDTLDNGLGMPIPILTPQDSGASTPGSPRRQTSNVSAASMALSSAFYVGSPVSEGGASGGIKSPPAVSQHVSANGREVRSHSMTGGLGSNSSSSTGMLGSVASSTQPSPRNSAGTSSLTRNMISVLDPISESLRPSMEESRSSARSSLQQVRNSGSMSYRTQPDLGSLVEDDITPAHNIAAIKIAAAAGGRSPKAKSSLFGRMANALNGKLSPREGRSS